MTSFPAWCVAILLLAVTDAFRRSVQHQIRERVEARLTLLEAENEGLKQRTFLLEVNNTALQEKTSRMDARVSVLEAENRGLQQKTSLLEANNTSLQQKTSELENELNRYHDAFHVTQEPEAVYDTTTDSWHIALKCGMVANINQSNDDVLWQRPSGDLASTKYENGYFYLHLPNPVKGGNYTCILPENVTATACVSTGAGLSPQSAIFVDRVEARLTLLEAENTDLKKQVKQYHDKMEARRTLLEAKNMALEQKISMYHDAFHVTQEPEAVYDTTTDSWHIALKCGIVANVNLSSDDVLWQTPSGDLASTKYENGYFYLHLPNPVKGGNYTCILPANVTATACVSTGAGLSPQSAVFVDRVEARLTLMEARLTLLEARLTQLEAENTALKQYKGAGVAEW
nr:hypothetical protein BaRGS_032718 [Batillaria attramentaria]